MDEGTKDGQGSSQDEAAGKRIEALEQRVEELTGLLEAAGKGQGGGGDGQKPDEQNDGSQPDDDTPGWFRRLIGGKKAKADEEREPEKKPDEQGDGSRAAGEQKPDKPDADEAPPWAKAIAQKLDALEQQQGHGVAAKRSEVLDGLHVREEARELGPLATFNPFTEEGRVAAEKWAAENSWALTVRRVSPPKVDLSAIPDDSFVSVDKSQMGEELGRLGRVGADIQSRWGGKS